MNESVDPAAAALFSTIAVNRTLGMVLESSSPGEATISMPADPCFTQETGLIQGGVLTALADTAAVYGIFPFLDPGRTMSGLELKINFLRVARPGPDPLVAVSKTLHHGRSTAVSEVEIKQKGKLVAKATLTFLFLAAH